MLLNKETLRIYDVNQNRTYVVRTSHIQTASQPPSCISFQFPVSLVFYFRSCGCDARTIEHTVNKPEGLNLGDSSVLQIGLNLKLYVG